MDIIIGGAGSVGFSLAMALSKKHNIIIMDKNEDAITKLQESIDVLAIAGNIENPKIYESLQDKTIDIFIAVTDIDEINLISTIIASEKMKVKRKIIRLKNDFFARSSVAEKIGITDAIFPYHHAAQSIKTLLNYPKANNVRSFLQTTNKLISIKIHYDHQELLSVSKIGTDQVKVVGIESGKRFFVPNGDDKIRNGDLVYLFGKVEQIRESCKLLNHVEPKTIKNIAIFGADTLGVEIAQALNESGVTIKLIEKDLKRCQEASEILKNSVTVINSKYGDFRFYDDEGLKNADVIIASTSNDEKNIIKCIEAKEHGVPKVIAINNDIEHYNLMHSLGIVSVRGPKINAFYSILEIIGSNAVVTEKHFCGGSGLCFLKEIENFNQTISPLNTAGVISYIIADDRLGTFHAKVTLQQPVIVATFCLREKEEEVREWINRL